VVAGEGPNKEENSTLHKVFFSLTKEVFTRMFLIFFKCPFRYKQTPYISFEHLLLLYPSTENFFIPDNFSPSLLNAIPLELLPKTKKLPEKAAS